MINQLAKKALGSVLGRWVLGGIVAVGVGTAALMWHNHKEGLREEGIQECVQEINQATIDELERALADERSAAAELRASLDAAAAANREAIERRKAAESTAESLRKSMERQRNEDPTYREWSDTPLPSGVADRLREAAGSSTGSGN